MGETLYQNRARRGPRGGVERRHSSLNFLQMVIMGVMVLVTVGILNWHLTLVIAPLLPIFYVLQRRYTDQAKRGSRQRPESTWER